MKKKNPEEREQKKSSRLFSLSGSFLSKPFFERPLASLSFLLLLLSHRSHRSRSLFSPVVPQWLHGPPARDDGPAFPAVLADGEGVEGRCGVEDDEGGDENWTSIFGVVVVVITACSSGGAIVAVHGTATTGAIVAVVVVEGRVDIENAHPNALEASSGLAARSRPVSSKIIGR